ncbi:protein adenylyltransferase SelO [Nocardioides acrostichi]|uniref:Protein nucleotidyltransferase YdiU n=1 Tax=Nocardioides acrostichi TaxID=2784339 RepID=A0A930Y931_9ACTN|nr:YdiU family protein [Nocardioides acrostichi]MBF4163701.1 YdiU family protein [Nocardioides acrostichi]
MTIALGTRFADAFPELAVPWQGEEAPAPSLLLLNEPLAADLGLEVGWLRSDEGLAFLQGRHVPDAARPVAQGYAGHQFGGYSPRLGDGRALLLGELTLADGGLRDLHLKGSGRTPWSRGGDGLAVVGPMLREYVVSEAMHALGVPTTRSLAVTATGRDVRREVVLPGAVLARVASSHLRVGTFQYAAAMVAAGQADLDLLQRLVDHAIARHHPDAGEAANPALALLEAVSNVQAELVAQWMGLGFVHGVLNTDNVLLSGETVDYGPCAFLDAFDASAVFSSIDEQGRYAFGNQPSITQWNLSRFAETLLPLIARDSGGDQDQAVALAVEVLERFPARYGDAYAARMAAKLGLPVTAGRPGEGVVPIVEQLLALLQAEHPDLTGFFRDLSSAARGNLDPARDRFVERTAFDAWAEQWLRREPDVDAMDAVNPVYIPRNHLVEQALDAATSGDLTPVETLLEAVTDPFTERPGLEAYTQPAPDSFGRYVTYCGT